MLEILNPRHGAILNRTHGSETSEALTVTIRGCADALGALTVNGVPATREGTGFTAEVPLTAKSNEIRAELQTTRGTQTYALKVLWDKASFRRYRFYIDDHSFCFDDIARHGYDSIFDCFYFDALRRLHREYGMKVVLNIFFRNDHGDFELSEFPDRYQGEWIDNSDWLKLAFHAYSEFPNRPYQYASAQKLATDFDLVREQIIRFAGEETYCPPSVIHWAMLPPANFALLRERGVRVLGGQYLHAQPVVDEQPGTGPCPDIGYFLDVERAAYLVEHGVLHDFDHGITYSRGDCVFNLVPKDQVIDKLAIRLGNQQANEVVGLASHEQYSFPFYSNHLPDHFERMDIGLRHLTENGYVATFPHEGLLGNTAWEDDGERT